MEKKRTVKISDVLIKAVLVLICAVLVVYALSMIGILCWGLLSSLKSGKDFSTNAIGLPVINNPEWPKGIDDPRSSYYTLFHLKNYADVINQFYYEPEVSFFSGENVVTHRTAQNFFTMLFNSIFYALGNGVIQAIVPAVVGFMCAKYSYKFSKAVYVVVLVVMTLPIVGAYPSELTFLRNLGLYDTWYGNFIQRFSFTGMYFLVFYEFFKGMPDTYGEAADIDGASQWCIMTRIYMPMAVKMIGSVVLIKFIFFWNDFASIKMYMPTHPTLAYFIYLLPSGQFTNDFAASNPIIIASCMILAIPTIIIFLALQGKIMGSMTLGGLKE